MARTIQSPGVEINEIDLSLRPDLPVGTNILIPGFAPAGPVDEVLQVASLSEFEQMYGLPSNATERYFYHTVRAAFQSPGNIYVTRLPYGADRGNNFADKHYSATLYPVKLYKTVRPELQIRDRFTAKHFISFIKGLPGADESNPGGTELTSVGYTPDVHTVLESIAASVDGDKFLVTQSGLDQAKINATQALHKKLQAELSDYANQIVWDSGTGITITGDDVTLDNGSTLSNHIATHLSNTLSEVDATHKVIDDTGHSKYSMVWDAIIGYNSSAGAALGQTVEIPQSALHSIMSDPDQSDVYVNISVGRPTFAELSEDEFQDVESGSIDWSGDADEIYIPQDDPERGADETPTNYAIRVRKHRVDEKRKQLGSAGIIILNNKSHVINEKFEGYYVGLADNDDFFPNSDYSSIKGIETLNKNGAYRSVPESRLSFPVESAHENSDTGVYVEGSISEVYENLPESDISNAEFNDILVLGVFKLRKSTLDPDTEKLDYVLSEYHIGSLNANRERFDPTGGTPVSYNLSDVSSESVNLRVVTNTYIQESGDWIDRFVSRSTSEVFGDGEEAAPSSRVKMRVSGGTNNGGQNLFPHGIYKEVSGLANQVGAIPSKLDRVFELIDNHELFPLDITCEAGLGTIFAATNGGTDLANYDDEKKFHLGASVYDDPSRTFDTLTGPTHNWDYRVRDDDGNVIVNDDGTEKISLYSTGQQQFLGGPVMWYRNVANRFVEFAAKKRKDHMCILDPLRHLFVQGVNATVLSDKKNNFSQHVYWPLRHIYQSINTSYGAVYGNWAKAFDGQLGRNVWVPMSGYMAAMYANTDANFYPWFAPAGFTRGVLNGIADIAIYPKQKHRDQLYKINVNPVANFPNDGFTVFGQKTLQAKPSAFDRINVRRLFLWCEKATRATAKYFIFEPNTLFTRTQVVNVLTPIFDRAKNTQGMYDYLLICDERNNTPDVIDQNEMVIDIYIKPVRAAEFILVNFYATRTGQDFSELVS